MYPCSVVPQESLTHIYGVVNIMGIIEKVTDDLLNVALVVLLEEQVSCWVVGRVRYSFCHNVVLPRGIANLAVVSILDSFI